MKWDVVASLKKVGGLGICRARLANTVMLVKLAWTILAIAQKLWVQVLISKHLNGQPFLCASAKSSDLVIWKSIIVTSLFIKYFI